MDIEKYKVIYMDFIPDDLDKGESSIKKLWERVVEFSQPKLLEFENENKLKIQALFNKTNSELSLYHYLPDNRETQEKCLSFLENLNLNLERSIKNHPLI